jgi:glycosyltransferase involved in cell wall biosynthesis
LEAQASRTPVIAFRKGGATETVKEFKSGLFFDNQETNSIIAAIKEFERSGVKYTPQEIRQSVAHFSEELYQNKINRFVMGCMGAI